jgi:Ran GTPase-activating protein (RanGAP) involved in mRNA processing and transport
VTPVLYQMMKDKDKNFKLMPQVKSYEVDLADEAEDNYVRNMLNISDDDEEKTAIDGGFKKTVGDTAVGCYYKHYKELSKVKEQNSQQNLRASVYTGMLKYSDKHNLLPNKCGIIKVNGSTKNLNVRNQLLGRKYIGMVAEGIKRIDYDKIDVKNNRLDTRGADKLIKSLRNSHKILDLSYNNIRGSTSLLKPILNQGENMLQVLKLDKNQIGDHACNELLASLATNKNLKALHMNDNHLTDKIADKLSELLFNHYKLAEIYFRWNNISSFGGKKIFNVLVKNDVLVVADFGWNILGESYRTIRTDSGFIEEICTFLHENRTMLHLDISNNHFTMIQSERIASALGKNNTIYGFHFTGNFGYVDAENFLMTDGDLTQDNSSLHLLKEINGVHRSTFNA